MAAGARLGPRLIRPPRDGHAALASGAEPLADFRGMLARILFRLGVALVWAAVAPAAHAVRDTAPLVAAAADLRFALDEIAAAFARDTGMQVRLVYGSSGNSTRSSRLCGSGSTSR